MEYFFYFFLLSSFLFKVLEDDTDLAMMNLTRMYQNPEDYVQPLCAEVLEDHEEMELLLEAYLQVGDANSSSPCSACRSCMLGTAVPGFSFFPAFCTRLDRRFSVTLHVAPKSNKKTLCKYVIFFLFFSGFALWSFN